MSRRYSLRWQPCLNTYRLDDRQQGLDRILRCGATISLPCHTCGQCGRLSLNVVVRSGDLQLPSLGLRARRRSKDCAKCHRRVHVPHVPATCFRTTDFDRPRGFFVSLDLDPTPCFEIMCVPEDSTGLQFVVPQRISKHCVLIACAANNAGTIERLRSYPSLAFAERHSSCKSTLAAREARQQQALITCIRDSELA